MNHIFIKKEDIKYAYEKLQLILTINPDFEINDPYQRNHSSNFATKILNIRLEEQINEVHKHQKKKEHVEIEILIKYLEVNLNLLSEELKDKFKKREFKGNTYQI